MATIIEAIKVRVSSRTYSNTPMKDDLKRNMSDYIHSNDKGPFGNKMRFELLDLSEMERSEVRKYGTYGMIKNAKSYIVGVIQKGPKAMEDFGYCMEKNILHATKLGLGTCWLGGTFRRSSFGSKIGINADEVIPAITPIGHPSEKRSFRDSLVRFSAGSKKRKKWQLLFFRNDMVTPLSQDEAAEFTPVLESVRLAPSASNRQPWRIVKEDDRTRFHFFCSRTKGYDKLLKDIRLQNIDMGIAMCHFELAAKELGLQGKWEEMEPEFDHMGTEYIVSWTESE